MTNSKNFSPSEGRRRQHFDSLGDGVCVGGTCIGQHMAILNRWDLGLPFTKCKENCLSVLKLL